MLSHKNDPAKYVPPSKEIVPLKRPFPEGNTSDGSEFMDDAIYMNEEQPPDVEE